MAPTVSIIIPAYNEEKGIGKHLEDVLAFLKEENLDGEILVVDDGSQDQTIKRVEEISKNHPQVKVIPISENRGKGHAVRTGLLRAKGEVCGFTDADQATPIGELKKVLTCFENSKVDVVIGSRAKFGKDAQVEAHLHRRIIGRVFNLILLAVVGVKDLEGKAIQDTQCGFKWMTQKAAAEIIPPMTIDGFAFDVEMLYLANRKNLAVAELPINWVDRDESRVNLLLDPIKMFLQVCQIPLRHRSTS